MDVIDPIDGLNFYDNLALNNQVGILEANFFFTVNNFEFLLNNNSSLFYFQIPSQCVAIDFFKQATT